MLLRHMNHNKYNLQVGQEVILDKDYNNTHHVIIDGFTPMYMFATVHSVDVKDFNPDVDCWGVMTNRLTPFYGYNSEPNLNNNNNI